MVPSPGFVSFTGGGHSVEVMLGEGHCTITGGYGGWDVIARPQAVGIATWRGFEPLRMTVPILFNHHGEGEGAGLKTQAEILTLEKMAGRGITGTRSEEPPIVTVDAPGGVVPHQDQDWVIESIDWGDGIVHRAGNWTRRAAVVTLLQKKTAPKLEERASRRSGGKGAPSGGKGGPAKSASKTVKVREGQTLRGLAKTHLGDADRWKDIAKLNDIRDPRNLKEGATIKIPPKTAKKPSGQ